MHQNRLFQGGVDPKTQQSVRCTTAERQTIGTAGLSTQDALAPVAHDLMIACPIVLVGSVLAR
jgi:hypothetical protein